MPCTILASIGAGPDKSRVTPLRRFTVEGRKGWFRREGWSTVTSSRLTDAPLQTHRLPGDGVNPEDIARRTIAGPSSLTNRTIARDGTRTHGCSGDALPTER